MICEKSREGVVSGIKKDFDREEEVYARVNDQIRWYDAKAGYHKNRYYFYKTVQIIFTSIIPVIGSASFLFSEVDIHKYVSVVVSLLGGGAGLIEAVLQINQFQTNWISYRGTCENLKHEKHLYMSGAGRYKNCDDPLALLAEVVESLVSSETSRWISNQNQVAQSGNKKNQQGGDTDLEQS